MNISQASQACGLPAKTIRFYEEIGLVVPERQASNSYRVYAMRDVERLRFLQRARAVGFGIDECRQLLTFYCDPEQRDEQVKALLDECLLKLDQHFIAFNAMRINLELMIAECSRLDQVAITSESGAKSQPPLMAFRLVDSGRD